MTSGNENGSQRFQDIQDAVSERYSGIAERVLFNTVEVGASEPEARMGDASLWEVRVGVNYNF